MHGSSVSIISYNLAVGTKIINVKSLADSVKVLEPGMIATISSFIFSFYTLPMLVKFMTEIFFAH